MNILPVNGEGALREPLLEWLQGRRYIRAQTAVAVELPWLGRHIDVATRTSGGVLSAYELKINHTRRALEQASFNRLAFHRSYIVMNSRPTDRNLRMAELSGIGVIVATPKGFQVVQQCVPTTPDPRLCERLRALFEQTKESGGACFENGSVTT